MNVVTSNAACLTRERHAENGRDGTRTNHDRHCQGDKSDVLIGRWLTVSRMILGRVRSTRGELPNASV